MVPTPLAKDIVCEGQGGRRAKMARFAEKHGTKHDFRRATF